MAGIPVHTSSPINPNTATKPTGITPRTSEPAPTTAAPTTTNDASSYPAAQPGAPPGPAPTGAVQPTPTQKLQAPTTATQPPPPQPGAVPSAPQTYGTTARQTSPIPPPPKAGEVAPLLPHQQQGSLSDPSQISRAQPPASVTSTTNTSGVPIQDLSHPPGYQQNSQASFADRQLDAYNPLQNQSGHGSAGGKTDDGILGATSAPIGEEEGKSLWETAGDFARTAGKKLSEGHDEIWRRINNEK